MSTAGQETWTGRVKAGRTRTEPRSQTAPALTGGLLEGQLHQDDPKFLLEETTWTNLQVFLLKFLFFHLPLFVF